MASHDWAPPRPQDSRSPCPMVNTLANHGYLPRDGRNVTAQHFADAVVAALNAEPGYGSIPAQAIAKATGKEHFDLEDLNTPGVIRHVASLVHNDVTPSNPNMQVDAARVTALLDDSHSAFVDAESLARTRARVEELSLPDKIPKDKEGLAITEASLVLLLMSDQTGSTSSTEACKAPKDRVRAWLTEERLPFEFGWKPSEKTLLLTDLAPIAKDISEARKSLSSGP